MNKLKINMISETEFTVKGHGVHTAYLELTNALKKRDDCDVTVNKWRKADVTHVQTIGGYSLLHLLFGSGKKVVSAHVVPASFVGSIAGAKYWLPFMKVYLKFFYRRADMVFAVSNMVRDVLIQEFKIDPKKVVTFYNVIDMAQYKTTLADKVTARKKLGIKDDTFVVVGNGQVQPRKRVDIFVEMAKNMSEVRFIWVGGIPFKALGAESGAMQQLMDNLPENMTITGVIDLKDVKQYYQAADVFVLPAMQENHPMCVLEAAGVGLPIVLRAIPEYDDTFADAALVVHDDEAFSSTVERLIADSRALATLAKQSAIIRERFDSIAGAEKALRTYLLIVNKH